MNSLNELRAAAGRLLDKAGEEINLPRVTRKGGHAFDELDGSYRRRIIAAVYGAAIANAERPRPTSLLTEESAAALLAEEPNEGPTAVLTDGSVVRGKAAEEILNLQERLRESVEEIRRLREQFRLSGEQPIEGQKSAAPKEESAVSNGEKDEGVAGSAPAPADQAGDDQAGKPDTDGVGAGAEAADDEQSGDSDKPEGESDKPAAESDKPQGDQGAAPDDPLP